MKKVLLSVLLVAMTVTLCGCETIAGFGKDMEKAGTAISDAAK